MRKIGALKLCSELGWITHAHKWNAQAPPTQLAALYTAGLFTIEHRQEYALMYRSFSYDTLFDKCFIL